MAMDAGNVLAILVLIVIAILCILAFIGWFVRRKEANKRRSQGFALQDGFFGTEGKD